MKKNSSFLKKIFLFSLFLSVFIGVGIFSKNITSPSLDFLFLKFSKTTPKHFQSISWGQSILDSFVRKYDFIPTQKKKNNSTWLLTLPKNYSYIQYTSDIQKIAKHFGVYKTKGIKYSNYTKNYFLDLLLEKDNQVITIKMKIGYNFLNNYSKLAIVFYDFSNFQQEDFLIISNTTWKKTFILKEKETKGSLFRYLNFYSKDKMLLELKMERKKLSNKKDTNRIYIHQTEEKINQFLTLKIQKYPNIIGFATWSGDRGIQNEYILNNIEIFLKNKNLLFLDFISPLNGISYNYFKNKPFFLLLKKHNDIKNLNTLLNKKVISVLKKDYDILVLPYSKKIIEQLNDFFSQLEWKRKKIELVNLETIFKIKQRN